MTEHATQHLDDLLAEYVDGTLGPGHRAQVEAHLAGCDRCREEVALARKGRSALEGLPEVAPPPGLGMAFRRRTPTPSRGVWVGAGVAAAAAAVLAGAIFIFGPSARMSGGGGGSAVSAPQGGTPPPGPQGEAAEAGGAPVPTIEQTDKDYSPSSLAALGLQLSDRARASLRGQALASTATRYYQGFDVASLPPRVRDVVDCVFLDVTPEQLLVPYVIQEASFEHEPAYVAAFLQGPSPDTPYDRVLIWVVDRQECTLRYYAAQRL